MRNHRYDRSMVFALAGALVLASCAGSDESPDGAASDTVQAADEPSDGTGAPATTAADAADESATENVDSSVEAADTTASDPGADGPAPIEFASLGPPSGEPIRIGMVNTEGTPGLDFPEMRTDTDLAVDYLNAHGGMGDRPIQLEHCASNGSPEGSQACAQELSAKDVEFVMLGLDLFPGYATFAATEIPVFGALPVLAADYTADALFLTGGNATTMAAMVALIVEHFEAESVGVISADNPGANGSEAALIAALDKAGVAARSIKGGDNETDAGFQGLLREANSDGPDVLVSLYSDAGCIGAMRARVSLGIDTPVVSTAICGSAEVIDVVGDEAVGWSFVGLGGPAGRPDDLVLTELIEPAYGDADSSSLGLGALGINQVMSLARVANNLAADGEEVTGPAIFDRLAGSGDDLDFLNGNPFACGAAASYPSVCSFHFPIGEYLPGGEIATVAGFEAVSVVDYLP